MSRSRRKTPIFGNSVSESDKPYKVMEHRRERRVANIAIRRLDDAPSPKEFGNSCRSPKDGKTYWPGHPARSMRK